MPSFKFYIVSVGLLVSIISCNKKVDVSYGIEDIAVYETKAQKQKAKYCNK